MVDDKKSYITVKHGLGGWEAVMMWWNPAMKGWEPYQMGTTVHSSEKKAAMEATAWAKDENMEFRP